MAAVVEANGHYKVAVGETVIPLHPPLPLVGVSRWMKTQIDSLANGYTRRWPADRLPTRLRCWPLTLLSLSTACKSAPPFPTTKHNTCLPPPQKKKNSVG